jgi:23S rRNA (uracil1939-C5)-methyltransferase
VAGKLGLYRAGSHDVLPLAHCPQLEPALDAALGQVIAAGPPDGELALVLGHAGDVAVSTEQPWPAADRLGFAAPSVEVEPGLAAGPRDFAQASAAGNAALIAIARAALGPGPGRLLELYAGGGNFTRGFAADGWEVVPSDLARPAAPPPRFEAGPADRVLARVRGPFDAIALDPPRTGAREAIEGILRHRPSTIVYISCDPATLGRDAVRLIGYRAERAWPVDVMPQTAHVEVVLRLVRAS